MSSSKTRIGRADLRGRDPLPLRPMGRLKESSRIGAAVGVHGFMGFPQWQGKAILHGRVPGVENTRASHARAQDRAPDPQESTVLTQEPRSRFRHDIH